MDASSSSAKASGREQLSVGARDLSANRVLLRSHFIAHPDGFVLHAEDSGVDGAACVLIHGTGDGAYVWGEVAAALQSKQRLILIDLRGHGLSEWDRERRYTGEQYCSDVVCVLDNLGIDQCTLVGHSLGGALAIKLAADWPRRVARLVVVDYAPRFDSATRDHARSQFLSQFRPYRSEAEYVEYLSQVRPMASRPTLEMLAGGALQASDGGFELRCDKAVAVAGDDFLEGDARRLDMRRVTAPTLFVRGNASAMVSRDQLAAMVRETNRAQVREVPGAGHAVMTDNPSGFLAAIGSFVIGR